MSFKGFDAIADLKYEQKIFKCNKCPNKCDVSEIRLDDSTLFYGDRCERFSGKAEDKNFYITDLFKKREKVLMNYTPGFIAKRKTVGIPRVGMFNELFPFWAVLLDELELNVKVSERTSKNIISKGLEKTTADFCFPFKIAFGHYASMSGNEIDYVFAPDVIESNQSKFNCLGLIKKTEWDKSFTCPYVQNIGAVVAKNTVKKPIINPHVFLRGNRKDLVKELQRAFDSVGEKVTKKKMGQAIDLAYKNHFNFKNRLKILGRKFLNKLKDKEKGVVIVGRPYSSYDSGVNLNLARKISNFRFSPIPMDFLPYPKENLSKKWVNEFGVQGQLILNAANVIKNKGLNAVFLDYFGCGPNSFFKTFFANEIGKPYLTLQLDEHTADAGVVTRLEAFLDSIK